MRFSRFVACGFGSGLAPIAAGTAGTAAALVLGSLLLQLSPLALPLAAVAATLGGVWAVDACGAAGEDPGWVVIDEFAGMWITLLGLTHLSAAGVLLAFVLFRLFDITKLGPVGWFDRQKTAIGVMGDDVVAGVIAGVLVRAAELAAPAWFA